MLLYLITCDCIIKMAGCQCRSFLFTTMPTPEADKLVEHLFRHEAGRMVAVLSRLFGLHNLYLAEDLVQEAFIKAHNEWKINIPFNPSAWLMHVAKNKALDVLRRESFFKQYSKSILIRMLFLFSSYKVSYTLFIIGP